MQYDHCKKCVYYHICVSFFYTHPKVHCLFFCIILTYYYTMKKLYLVQFGHSTIIKQNNNNKLLTQPLLKFLNITTQIKINLSPLFFFKGYLRMCKLMSLIVVVPVKKTELTRFKLKSKSKILLLESTHLLFKKMF